MAYLDTITCLVGGPINGIFERAVPTNKAHTRALKRIDDLHKIAKEENETWSDASAAKLKGFLANTKFDNRPYLSLLDNGNLRARWEREKDNQVGIQFLASGETVYVLFSKDEASDNVNRTYGRGSVQQLLRLVRALNLDDLVSGKT